MVKILNVGSVNIDHVMEVPAFVRPGETLASTGYQIFGGGKGANQSVAIARAGAHVRHIGKIGRDGLWLRDLLAEAGVDVSALQVGDTHTGFAMIQVDQQGENAIILYPGGNFELGEDDLDEAFTEVSPGDWLLLQNEIAPQTIAAAIAKGAELGLQIALNPAPMKDNIRELPLEKLSLLILNELEGESLAGCSDPSQIIDRLQARYPHLQIVLTLGREGVLWAHDGNQCHQPAYHVPAVDTTAAGDTFIGYFLATLSQGSPVQTALKKGAAAAALCVSRKGAMAAIPTAAEVNSFLAGHNCCH